MGGVFSRPYALQFGGNRLVREQLRAAGWKVVEAGDGIELKYIDGAINGAWDAVDAVESGRMAQA